MEILTHFTKPRCVKLKFQDIGLIEYDRLLKLWRLVYKLSSANNLATKFLKEVLMRWMKNSDFCVFILSLYPDFWTLSCTLTYYTLS